jgi:hypothetical protein
MYPHQNNNKKKKFKSQSDMLMVFEGWGLLGLMGYRGSSFVIKLNSI